MPASSSACVCVLDQTTLSALTLAVDRWKGVAEPGSDLALGLNAVARLDSSFDLPHFLAGAKSAYEMIVLAFAQRVTPGGAEYRHLRLRSLVRSLCGYRKSYSNVRLQARSMPSKTPKLLCPLQLSRRTAHASDAKAAAPLFPIMPSPPSSG